MCIRPLVARITFRYIKQCGTYEYNILICTYMELDLGIKYQNMVSENILRIVCNFKILSTAYKSVLDSELTNEGL